MSAPYAPQQQFPQDALLRSTRNPTRPQAPPRVVNGGPPDGMTPVVAAPTASNASNAQWPRRGSEQASPSSVGAPSSRFGQTPQQAQAQQRPQQQVQVPQSPPPESIPGPEVGWYTRQGIKPGNPAWVNQDSQLAMQLPGDRLLVGVFDGHGEFGHRASGTAKAVISKVAPTILGSTNSGAHQLRQLFAQVQSELFAHEIFQHSGTTATLALIDPVAGVAHVAHVGDSTLALYHGQNLVFESHDHRIDAQAEQRIRARGGAIQVVGAQKSKRVYMPDNGRGYTVGLSLDRSLGDLDLNQAGVISEPEVKENLIFQPGTVLIIGSDGVWDVVSKADARQTVGMHSDIEDCAHALVDCARSRWAAGQGQIDDITSVVVKW